MTSINKKRKHHDFGLGSKNSSRGNRALNKDGSFNVKKTNLSFFERLNFFHALITMSWPRFFGAIALAYFGINILFAAVYYYIGVDNLTGITHTTGMHDFMEAFFFSAQTVTTLGYGRVAPIGYAANIVAAVESMLGLLGFALATGLLYGRFSTPSAVIRYSHNAVVAPYQEGTGFMFRIVNPKQNQLLELEVKLSLSVQRENSELRDFYILPLERDKVAFMPFMWTIVHPIDGNSPLLEWDQNDLAEKDAEFIVSMKAFEESSSQTVYSRSSYKPSEIMWGKKFVYAVKRSDDGVLIDVSLLNATENVPLPV